MKIVAIADTHAKHHALYLPEGDVLLFAGDGEFRSVSDLINFNDWLAGLDYKQIVMIAGNHDFYCEAFPEEVKKYFTHATYLKDESCVLPNGMHLWGSRMTVAYLNWAFMDTEGNLDHHCWSKIPKTTDILLTHSPAYPHSDAPWSGAGHLGSKTLADKVKALRVPYVVHGHIHGGYGTSGDGQTTFINCSVLDEEYQLVNKPVVLEV